MSTILNRPGEDSIGKHCVWRWTVDQSGLSVFQSPLERVTSLAKQIKSKLLTWHEMIYSTHSSLNRIWFYSIGIVKIIQEGTCVFLSLDKVEVYARIGVSDYPYLPLDKLRLYFEFDILSCFYIKSYIFVVHTSETNIFRVHRLVLHSHILCCRFMINHNLFI